MPKTIYYFAKLHTFLELSKKAKGCWNPAWAVPDILGLKQKSMLSRSENNKITVYLIVWVCSFIMKGFMKCASLGRYLIWCENLYTNPTNIAKDEGSCFLLLSIQPFIDCWCIFSTCNEIRNLFQLLEYENLSIYKVVTFLPMKQPQLKLYIYLLRVFSFSTH